MSESMNGLMNWIQAEGKGHYFFLAFPVVILILFILFKGRRVCFLIPSLIITLIIVNPWFYYVWEKIGLYAYWRLLWMLPVIPVLAALIPCITEKMQNIWIKTGVVVVGIGLLVCGGSYLYYGDEGHFDIPAANMEKVPENVKPVADRLLELTDKPRIVAEPSVSVYIRQYSGDITTLYGRNAYGYISGISEEARKVHEQLSSAEGDLGVVSAVMANNGYDYLVLKNEGKEDQLAENSFELVDQIGPYGIYSAHGIPTLVKERNELGQVVSVTTVDENGQPKNGDEGYATVSYAYDDSGYVVREFYTDVLGRGVKDSSGRAGYEREYDSRGHIVREINLDEEGKPTANRAGYAEYRREYKGSDLVHAWFLDENGFLVDRRDLYYAEIRIEYDKNHNRTAELYFDREGKPVVSNRGYASFKRVYEGNKLISEAFFDENGNPVSVPAGYASRKRVFDEAGNLLAESYYDSSGNAVCCMKGYARVEYEYDQKRNIILQRFLDSENQLVVTASGYAEVHRVYDGKQLIREEYFGLDGKPLVQPAGHIAIEQTWEGDQLASRTYLGMNGEPMMRTDGYAKVVWEQDPFLKTRFLDKEDNEISLTGLNLVSDIKTDDEGWSEWMIPTPNTSNNSFDIGYVNLGEKAEGDVYTASLEIEFRGITAKEGFPFGFRAKETVDEQEQAVNIWSSDLVNLTEVPENGICSYSLTTSVSAETVDISNFTIGFRCDYWAGGSFRIRKVRIEKGGRVSDWTPGL